ncbi:MAG: carboxylating nicotinate-nucleotide diphosphorylase [Actinobacteria bacterium]|nr:carboxylating nicotinate-nucleotide diphosphorylase [Actinomycetota bacterium]
MSAPVRAAVEQAGLSAPEVQQLVERALEEDLGSAGDVTTTATVPANLTGSGDLVARVCGVVAGLPVAAWVFDAVSSGRLRFEYGTLDGARVESGEVLATVRGPIRDLLTAERTALNLLGHLSGIATVTRQWVDAIEDTGALLRDTRKTLPGLRALQKYAVRCGGGVNHRMSLSDAALVKDNHVSAAGGVVEAFALVRAAHPQLPLEIEVDTLAQARAVIDAGADLILLDNMSVEDMTAAVGYGHDHGARLEASGGLTLDRAHQVAATGVDYLSVGALTHSARVLDIGLDL